MNENFFYTTNSELQCIEVYKGGFFYFIIPTSMFINIYNECLSNINISTSLNELIINNYNWSFLGPDSRCIQ